MLMAPAPVEGGSYIFGSDYSWSLSHDPEAISYCAAYDLCDIEYVIDVDSEDDDDSSGKCFDFGSIGYESPPWTVTFDMGADFTFDQWRIKSHGTYAAGDMVLQYYDDSSSSFVDVSGSSISGTETSGWQESSSFTSVTASKWRVYISSYYHYWQLYVCEVQVS